MKKLTVAVLTVIVGLLALACDDDAKGVYLATGDSLAVGVGATDEATGGYVPLLLEALREGPADDSLELVNLGVGGETSATMLDEQLSAAVSEIERRNGNDDSADDVRFVTVGVGGNDGAALFDVCAEGLSDECAMAVATTLEASGANYAQILQSLRAAAGPDVPIATMTYFNALAHPDCALNAHVALGQAVLEGEPTLGIELGINDIIRASAAAADVHVVEISLDPSALTDDCRHANDSGHAVIAAAFAAVLSE